MGYQAEKWAFQRKQTQPTVVAMVCRYKQSVAACSAKHDYAFGDPPAVGLSGTGLPAGPVRINLIFVVEEY
jgi:hypothetical protein